MFAARNLRLERIAAALLPAFMFVLYGLTPQAAFAATPRPTLLWSQLNSALVIGVQGGSKSENAPAITWSANGNADQSWKLDYTTSSYQTIVNVNSGDCMGVGGDHKSAGDTVIQWPCNGNDDQQWSLVQVYNWAFELVNLESRMCLGIDHADPNQNGQVIIWPCNGNLDQYWYPDSAPLSPQVTPSEPWLAWTFSRCCGYSYTDPINLEFYYPNGDALGNLESDLQAEGWAYTACYNTSVWFYPGGRAGPPNYVMATDVGGLYGCGTGERDHVRLWASPDDHTVFMAASDEAPGCGVHCVVSFNSGRDTLYDDEINRLTGRTNYAVNYVIRYSAGTLQGVSYDGQLAIIEIG